MAFWKLAVGLGVPGFALGVFYMLFKGLKWDLNKKGPRALLALFMVLVTGLTLYALYRYAPAPEQSPYILHITVVDGDGRPVSRAKVSADASEQIRKLDKAWELVLRDRGKGETVTLYATKFPAHGQETVTLGAKKEVRVTIPLETPPDSTISGKVTDPAGEPVAGALITVLGYEDEGVITDERGHFTVNTHAPPGVGVRVSASKGNMGKDREYISGMPAGIQIQPREDP